MTLRRLLLATLLTTGIAGAASAQCDTSFTLINRSGSTVQEFYFGSSAQREWGVDQLGTNVLVNGQSMRFRARNAGANDFKIVWANGDTAELMRIDICVTSEIIATRRGIEAR
ncbi:hypothetical protein KTR66_17810 [Roseococcus sp. SDR]|uniref:hypothetical protein n=1 Tax=Roseococcus sp. SDR TaxID=2835532 RepID=UPI001BCF57FC|nr:hypothetical protein [Roseococcus sp. SDR]MBS7791861.1 hypothetical protein [Roseococcus sp. SDR]MBV1847175.1 hypothetical protein [Roseococcus sp. SDR]